jgi:hypothetical protein
MPAPFISRLATVQGKGLIHVGDEYLAGGYEVYRAFDCVVRTHHVGWFKGIDEVLTIPLGWPKGLSKRFSVKSIEARKYVWSFLGNQSASSRPEMLEALRDIKPNFTHLYSAGQFATRRLSRSEYQAVLDETVFVPCPMGNAMLETWRFYEALEAGCIPIVEARPLLRYHEQLLGPHPVPTVYRWSQSATLIQALKGNVKRLKDLQQNIVEWWERCKQAEQQLIDRFVSNGLEERVGQLATRKLPSTSFLWPVRRFYELLRHQSAMSLVRRAQRIMPR